MVRFTIRRDKKGIFKFAALQSDPGKILLDKFGLGSKDFDSFVYISGDQYFSKSTAGLKVLKELGGIWKLAYIFIYLPRPVRDIFYDMIAKTRYRIFGKRMVCMIPGTDINDRFLQ